MSFLWVSGCGYYNPADRVEKLARKYNNDHPTITHVKPSEVQDSTNAWVIVDVRTQPERDISWIPESIPLSTFEHQAHLYRNRPLLLYCTMGWRSGQKAEELARQGFQAHNLHAGILGWIHEGLPLVTFTGESSQVHVFGPQWNLAPDDYTSVW